MEKYNFDVRILDFDIEELVERLEKEHGRMIMRIPKMEQKTHFIYEFTAIFSDFSLLEAKMLVLPQFDFDGVQASIHVHGVYI